MNQKTKRIPSPFQEMLLKFWNAIVQLVFPHKCFLCANVTAHGAWLCNKCKLPVPKHDECCPYCSKVILDCICAHIRPHFDGADAPLFYTGDVPKGIWRFKYGGRSYYATYLAALMSMRIYERFSTSIPFHAICYVPMHWKKQRRRGFCPSELLARKLGSLLGLPVLDGALLHTGNRVTQARQKGMAKRIENAARSFQSGTRTDLAGLHLLLVDDVITTCATTSYCASLLKQQGAEKVFLLGVATTSKNQRRKNI